jgi:hypothetical protein
MEMAFFINCVFQFIIAHLFIVSNITNFWINYYLLKNDIIINDEIKQQNIDQNIKQKDILLQLIIEIMIIIVFSFVLIFWLDMIYKFIAIIVEIVIIMVIGFFTRKQRLIKYFQGRSGTKIKFESKIFSMIFAPFSSGLVFFYIFVFLLIIIIMILNNLK